MDIATANVEFMMHGEREETDCIQANTLTSDNRKWNYNCSGANLAISGRPLLSQSLADSFKAKTHYTSFPVAST